MSVLFTWNMCSEAGVLNLLQFQTELSQRFTSTLLFCFIANTVLLLLLQLQFAQIYGLQSGSYIDARYPGYEGGNGMIVSEIGKGIFDFHS